MIYVELEIGKDQVEDALVDMIEYDLVRLIRSVMERVGDASLVKELIGELGDTYTYLEETFGEASE